MNTNRTSCKFFFVFLLLLSFVSTVMAQPAARAGRAHTNNNDRQGSVARVISDGANGWMVSINTNGSTRQYGIIGEIVQPAGDELVLFPVSKDTVVCDTFNFINSTYTTSGIYHDTVYTSDILGYDGIIFTWNLTVNQTQRNTVSRNVCDSLPWLSGTLLASGTYVDTLQSVAECDSIVTLVLTIRHSTSSTDTHDSCDSYTWHNGTTYTTNNTTDTIHRTNAAGCDSLVTLNLSIRYSSTGTDVQNACDSYMWIDGNTYTANNSTATHTLTNAAGCDSTVTLNLTIGHSNTGTDTRMVCDSVVWIDGITYTANTNTATHTITNVSGCDSTVTLHLTVRHGEVNDTLPVVVCDSFLWYGNVYRTSGVYLHAISRNIYDCDISKRLNLTVYHGVPVVDTVEACDSHTWQGTAYTTSGVYTDPRIDVENHNCMVFDTLRLTIYQSRYSADTDTACNSYTWSKTGRTYTASDIYYNRTTTTHGCDSIDTLYLTIHYSTHNSQNQQACDSFVWVNNDSVKTYHASGTYYNTYANNYGCPCVDTLRLVVQYKIDSVLDTTVCDTFWWGVDSLSYTANNTYHASLLHGVCHDLYTLNLTVYNSVHHSATASACDSMHWSSTDSTYTATGTYVYSDTTVHGCDSTETLVLTINRSVYTDSAKTVCDSLVWHGTTYSVSGDYEYSYTTGDGCNGRDSLYLTIVHGQPMRYPAAVACDSFYWHDTTYTVTGEYMRVRIDTANNNCEAVDTLSLTINNSIHIATPATVCDSFHWSINDSIYHSSGEYINSDTTAAGCEKIDTLHLTVNRSVETRIDSIVCDSVLWHGTMYRTDTVTTFDTVTANGCDSLVTLNLTVVREAPNCDTVEGCEQYVWRGNTYTTAGVYTDTRLDTVHNLCPLVDTLVLDTIYASHHSYSYTVECDSFYWRLSDSTYREDGLYVSVYLDDNGCESRDSINLVIRHSVPVSIDSVVCDSIWWHDQRHDTTGVYTYYYRAPNSCYTTDTLRLTVYNSSYRNDTIPACDHYVWNDSTYTQSGIYIYDTLSEHGCIIADTLHLVITNYVRDTEVFNVCDSLLWHGTWYAYETDTATFDTRSSVSGCDSIITLNLPLRLDLLVR